MKRRMWRSWAWVALGLGGIACGDATHPPPPGGNGGNGSGQGGSVSSGGATSGGSVHAGGQVAGGGPASGGLGGSGAFAGTGGALDFNTGGKTVDPSAPQKNPNWIYDVPAVDGGPAVCLPVPDVPIYEFAASLRSPPGCWRWSGAFTPNGPPVALFPPGSHVALPHAAENGCGPRICECRDPSPDAGPPGRYLEWVCPGAPPPLDAGGP